ncbi:MAG TPA: Crp/Fnr family transcriptional regulator [Candidatus Baltobacteraceae bacterium]
MKRRKPRPSAPESREVTLESLRQNAILAGLAGADAQSLVERGSIVDLPLRAQIYEPNERISRVYFPLDCVLSVVTRMKDGSQIEVGTIGREGTSAIPLLLGATTTANESYCQVPGEAIVMDTKVFASLRAGEKFRKLLDRYVQAYVNMLGQLAACNRLHNVYERCARWLLMTHDRVDSSEVPLTHEFLAMMLGTQRSGVTIAAATLQNAGFISYGRGIITILDRAGLEGASCECYEVAREQFSGLLPAKGAWVANTRR